MSATVLTVSSKSLSDEQVMEVIEKARQWALLEGVQMRPPWSPENKDLTLVEYAPMTLFPSPIPEPLWQQAKSLQKNYNKLMHMVAHDHEFLEKSLANVIKVDEFTKKLWDIYVTVRNEGLSQDVGLGLFRNDYMLDVRGSCCDIHGLPVKVELKQIEFNTVSASFAGLSSGIWNVHRYTMTQAGIPFTSKQIPENLPSKGLAAGLLEAWKYYNVPSAAVVFVVQKMERNTMDQRWLEKQLFSLDSRVPVTYTTFLDASANCRLTQDKKLFLKGTEVAVLYFRDGYSPDNYTSEQVWSTRLMFEQSTAVKCPPVNLQLAGCKKIQQELATPGALERYFTDKDICDQIRSTFAGQYSLDMGAEGDKNVAMALKNPKNFVVKPQREGGGNNIYGEDIVKFLEDIGNSEERNAYILMDRIFPWPQKNYLLKQGRDPILRDVISEMGIYGVYLGSADKELCNEEVGHLLRTKSNEDNEGGIMAGFATIDSPLIVQPLTSSDMEKCGENCRDSTLQ